MGIQSLANREHIGHLYGDVAALLIVAAALGFLMPRSSEAPAQLSSV